MVDTCCSGRYLLGLVGGRDKYKMRRWLYGWGVGCRLGEVCWARKEAGGVRDEEVVAEREMPNVSVACLGVV